MRVKGAVSAQRNARVLRRMMSLPEVLLWRALRGKPAGLTFRRQHPAGPYVIDFFCAPANLAIEVDGEAHSRGDRPSKDAERDRWLETRGIATLRLPASQVLSNLEGCLQLILATARERVPPPPPAAVPLPRLREGGFE